jgi:hypothetical protein
MSFVLAILLLSPSANCQEEYYMADEGDEILLVDSFGIQIGVTFSESGVAVNGSLLGGLFEFRGAADPFGSVSGWAMMSGDIYRGGGRTAKNLTPSKKDLEGKEPGLSVTTTPTKGWKLPGIKKLEELGFEVVPDPTEDDPNHHVIRPGKKLIDQGHTLREWIDGRDGIDEEKKETWPPLTKMLKEVAEEFVPKK